MKITGSRVPAIAAGLVVLCSVYGPIAVDSAGTKTSKAPLYSLANVGPYGGEPSIASQLALDEEGVVMETLQPDPLVAILPHQPVLHEPDAYVAERRETPGERVLIGHLGP